MWTIVLARLSACYTRGMSALTIKEVASMGGKARAKKYTKKQLREMGKKGGRPRKLDKTS